MKKKKSPLGRPPLNIDPEQVKKLAAIQCTMVEIAHVVNCSVDTLERHFADIIKEGRSFGVMSQKRKMFEKVLEGDNTMIIWFGKNYCGQSDRHEINSTQLNIVHTVSPIDEKIEKARLVEEIRTMLEDKCPTLSYPLLPESLPQ